MSRTGFSGRVWLARCARSKEREIELCPQWHGYRSYLYSFSVVVEAVVVVFRSVVIVTVDPFAVAVDALAAFSVSFSS